MMTADLPGMKQNLSHTKRLLATTALRSQSLSEGPDVFISSSCFLFPGDAELEQRALVVSYPWTSIDARVEGLKFCQALTDKLIHGLAPYFAKLLQSAFSGRQATLLLGPTLSVIVQSSYHNFKCLERAVAEFGPLISYGVCREDYLLPETTTALMEQLFQDQLQLQLYSELYPALAIEFKRYSKNELRRGVEGAPGRSMPMGRKASLAARCVRSTGKRLMRMASRHARCVLYNSNHTPKEALELAAKSALKIMMLPLVKLDRVSWPCASPELRQELSMQVSAAVGSTPFEQALVRIIQATWPISLLEGLNKLNSIVASQFPAHPKAIASGMAWVSDDAFKLWCVRSIKSGARLVSTQHGGDYGLCHTSGASKAIEYSVCDRFITWGGAGDQAPSHATLPVPPHYLVEWKAPQRGPILYIGTSLPRSPLFIEQVPTGPLFLQYLNRQVEFFEALRQDLRDELLMRPNPAELGWGIVPRLRQSAPGMRIDDFSRSFSDLLQTAKLAVVDNLNTTFLQSIGSGVPTILVWDPDVWGTNDDAARALDLLELAGVYFRSPQAAASAIDRIWQDPTAWWKSPPVVSAVNNLLDHYMHRDKDWSHVWAKELMN